MKKIILILLTLVVAILVIAAFLPKEFEIQAETTINAPQLQVWNYVKLLANQENYSVRVMADPNVQLSYSGMDGTIGFVQSRKSDMTNVGVGEQKIVAMQEGLSYDVEIKFEEPMKTTNYAKTILETVGPRETKVITTFRGANSRPINLLCFLFKGQVRSDMQQTMNNLKAIIEQ